MYVIFVLPTLFSFLALAAVASKSKGLSSCSCCLFFIMFPIMLLFCVVLLPMSTFIADACLPDTIDNFIYNTTGDAQVNSALSFYLDCPTNAVFPFARELKQAKILLDFFIENHADQFLIDEMQTLVGVLTDLADCQKSANDWAKSKRLLCSTIFDGLVWVFISSTAILFFLIVAWISIFVFLRRLRTVRDPEVEPLLLSYKRDL